MIFNKHSNFFLIYSIFIFIIGVILTPPYQSPDEFSHFEKSYSLSSGKLIPSGNENLDRNYLDIRATYSWLPFHSEHKLNAEMINRIKELKWGDIKVIDDATNTDIYFPIVYFPQSIGIVIGKILGLSIYYTYFISKILTILCSLSIILYANKLYKFNILTLITLSLPMTIFQLGSTSPDSLIFSLSILLGAFLARIVYSDIEFKRIDFFKILVILFVLVTTKFSLYPLLLIPFFISKMRKIKYGFLLSFFFVILSLCWIFISLKLISSGEGVHFQDSNTLGKIFHYLTNLNRLIYLYKETIFDSASFKGILTSFIGVLGWLDTFFDKYVYCIFFVFISIPCLYFLCYSFIEKPLVIIFSCFLAISIFLLTYFILLVTWNPIDTNIITGVQGRYFIPILLIFSFIIGGNNFNNSERYKKLESFIPILVLLFSVAEMVNLLINRYYLALV